MKIRENYHTHTYRCKHAFGDVDDYCRAAIENGLEILGIADHTPFPDNKWSEVKMDICELDDYCQKIDEAKIKFPELTIFKGLECEFRPEYKSFYTEELLGRRQLDYIILGHHHFLHNGDYLPAYGGPETASTLRSYTDGMIKAMETGLFEFVAHPDVFGNTYQRWDENCISCSRDIIQAAESLKIPLEINGYGIRKPKMDVGGKLRYQYPLEPFWQLAAEYDIEVVVNSDAHSPEDIIGGMAEGFEIVNKYGLKLADFSHLIK